MFNLDILQEYDWQQAFGFCCNISSTIGSSCSTEGIAVEDVLEIIDYDNGENDGDDWIMVFKTKDGRYVFLSAWCDYTGWDCRSGGGCIVSNDLYDLYTYGLTDGARSRLFKKEKPSVIR